MSPSPGMFFPRGSAVQLAVSPPAGHVCAGGRDGSGEEEGSREACSIVGEPALTNFARSLCQHSHRGSLRGVPYHESRRV